MYIETPWSVETLWPASSFIEIPWPSARQWRLSALLWPVNLSFKTPCASAPLLRFSDQSVCHGDFLTFSSAIAKPWPSTRLSRLPDIQIVYIASMVFSESIETPWVVSTSVETPRASTVL